MKKIIAILLSFIISLYSCSISAPSWTNIGSERIYIEDCRDTFKIDQIDSVLKTHSINYKFTNWSNMKYYTPEKEELSQYIYIKKDTSFVINKINAENCIFYRRYLNKNE